MNMLKVGAFLKKLRNEKKLTQEELASKLGVARRTVSRWETGYNLPDIDILIELSEFYEVELKELLKGETTKLATENKENETAILMADYNVQKNINDAHIAILFFIAGLLGSICSILLRNIDIGHTFISGFIKGVTDCIGPCAMVIGLIYAYENLKRLNSEKKRINNKS